MKHFNPPYIHRKLGRKGQQSWNYRRVIRVDGKRKEISIPLPGYPGNPADPEVKKFIEAWNKAHQSFDTPVRKETTHGTIDWLIERYLGTPGFKEKADKTKSEYLRYLGKIRGAYGKEMWSKVDIPFVIDLRDKHQDTPSKANNLVNVLSVLGKVAKEAGIRKDNPASEISKLKVGEWRPWEDWELEKFENECKVPVLLSAFNLALYTGQRRGDVLDINKDAVVFDNEGVALEINVRQEKTTKELCIPVHANLKTLLARDATYYVHKQNGDKYSKDGFYGAWNKEIKRLGLNGNGLTFHGLRKNAAINLIEAGCTEQEACAVTGQSVEMLRHYIKKRDQKKLAHRAMNKLPNNK